MNKTLLLLALVLYFPNLYAQGPFITTWKTDNPGTSEDNQITIPTFESEVYDYTVYWGDGTSDTNVTGDITHTYASQGTYTVQIEGVFPRIYFEDPGNTKDTGKIIAINQWGSIQWTSMAGAFADCNHLDLLATDLPDLTQVTNFSKMFSGCIALEGNVSISNWDVSNGSNFSLMFRKASLFNQPIGNWNMSNAVDMYEMFREATAFNQDISSWETGMATYMSFMFYGTSFNRDISSWNVSNVTHFMLMFGDNPEFNQDISAWDVSKAIDLAGMFRGATSFNQDIGTWDVANVQYMYEMFSGAVSFNQNLGNWDIGNAGNLTAMFNNSGLSTSNYDLTLIGWNQLPSLKKGIGFDATGIQYCEGGPARRNISIVYGWEFNDGGITNDCEASQQRAFITTWDLTDPGLAPDYTITIPIHEGEVYEYNIDWGDGTVNNGQTGSISHSYNAPGTYKVIISGSFPRIVFGDQGTNSQLITRVDQWGDMVWTSMESAFSNCSNLDVVAQDLPNLSQVTSADGMFRNCNSLVGNFQFNAWDVSSLQLVNEMFAGTTLFNQILSNWQTSAFTRMNRMFFDSGYSKSLGNWDVSGVTEMLDLLGGSQLTTVNYDNTLLGWAELATLQPNIQFNGGASRYCISAEARQTLADLYGWTLTDAGANCPAQRPFVTTWKTDNPGDTDDFSIAFPVQGGPYSIDWGDGTVQHTQYGTSQHTYQSSGVYTVSISGSVSKIFFNGTSGNPGQNDNNKLIEINQWGDIRWLEFGSAFSGCENMDVMARDTPDLSLATSLFSMFQGCKSMKGNSSFNDWDVSSINNMSQVFSGCSLFNADISDWDVSSVTTMNNLFNQCENFNQDISTWDVSNVTTMGYMFSATAVFNQDIGGWNTSKVTNVSGMFQSSVFNQDITNWDMTEVTDMSYMFNQASHFNQPIGKWDVSNVANMSRMLSSTEVFDQDLSNWNVSRVVDMSGMFALARSFNQDISDWNVSGVTDMSQLFLRANEFNRNLAEWDVSSVRDMTDIFSYSGLSDENYDTILIGWASLPNLQRAVPMGAEQIRYCQSEPKRQELIDGFQWIISDAGKIPLCDEDSDGDGVLDHVDVCLNTSMGVQVDSNGCDLIPVEALSVLGRSLSCPGSNDGAIEILMVPDGYLMDLTITGPELDSKIDDFPSSQPYQRQGLPAGTYEVTVAIPEVNFTQSYGLTIQEPQTINAKRTAWDEKGHSATYEVSGSRQYFVKVNNKEFTYQFDNDLSHTLQLSGLKDFNEIQIYSGKDCLGIIDDTLVAVRTFLLSATLIENRLQLFSELPAVEMYVYSLDGSLLGYRNFNNNAPEKTMELNSLNSGIYLVLLKAGGREETIKIFKK